MPHMVPCEECEGTRKRPCKHCDGDKVIECPRCEGSGRLRGRLGTCPDCIRGDLRCPYCYGSGRGNDACRACKGAGWVPRQE
jgi:DnaJ-class molecular chaperone